MVDFFPLKLLNKTLEKLDVLAWWQQSTN